MKIAVCLAIYNGEKYLEAQVSSIIHQLSDNDELIVVDDGSSDASLEIIERYQDARIKIYRNDRNLGPQKTFERALKLASGNLIFFSDQDDIWASNKVAEFKRVFQESGCAAIVSDASVIDENGVVTIKSFFKYRNSGPGVLKNFVKNTYLGCCMAIDKRVKDWALPFPDNITQHDEWIGLVCDFMDHVVFLEQPLTLYRRHTTNASSAKRLPIQKVVQNRVRMLMAMMQRFPGLYKRRLTKARSKAL
jgi:glycosyltransferase involved in cell wall biosynthesis